MCKYKYIHHWPCVHILPSASRFLGSPSGPYRCGLPQSLLVVPQRMRGSKRRHTPSLTSHRVLRSSPYLKYEVSSVRNKFQKTIRHKEENSITQDFSPSGSNIRGISKYFSAISKAVFKFSIGLSYNVNSKKLISHGPAVSFTWENDKLLKTYPSHENGIS